jgi:hypothetical protein
MQSNIRYKNELFRTSGLVLESMTSVRHARFIVTTDSQTGTKSFSDYHVKRCRDGVRPKGNETGCWNSIQSHFPHYLKCFYGR